MERRGAADLLRDVELLGRTDSVGQLQSLPSSILRVRFFAVFKDRFYVGSKMTHKPSTLALLKYVVTLCLNNRTVTNLSQ